MEKLTKEKYREYLETMLGNIDTITKSSRNLGRHDTLQLLMFQYDVMKEIYKLDISENKW